MMKTAGILGRDDAIFVSVDATPSSTNLPRILPFLRIFISLVLVASACWGFSSDLSIACCLHLLEISCYTQLHASLPFLWC